MRLKEITKLGKREAKRRLKAKKLFRGTAIVATVKRQQELSLPLHKRPVLNLIGE